ncbi:MAG: DUF1292 domain-containing protein [Bacilli bacterium]|nr:DUF1292 domain-containing protein [Bacilli bacterium]
MKINAIDVFGRIKEYEAILTYHSDEYNKNYVVYTDNEYDTNDELIIYISSYNITSPETIVKNIDDKQEYNKIKTEINKILLTIKNESEKLDN